MKPAIDKKELARKGEELAAAHLLSSGHKILRRNYRFDKAEVDIISEHEDQIVFTEVKTRISAYLSDPALLVPVSKQKQIIKVADQFLKVHYPEKEARFDIAVVITNSEYTNIDHIVDAYYHMG